MSKSKIKIIIISMSVGIIISLLGYLFGVIIASDPLITDVFLSINALLIIIILFVGKGIIEKNARVRLKMDKYSSVPEKEMKSWGVLQLAMFPALGAIAIIYVIFMYGMNIHG